MNGVADYLLKPHALIGVSLISLVLLMAIIGTFYTPYEPLLFDIKSRLMAPDLQHWFGTDQFGRDLLSRMISATVVTVSITGMTVMFAMILGTFLGALAGYLGGWVDRVVVGIMDAFLALPSIVMALAIMVVLGPGRYGVVLALGLAYSPHVMRVVRATVLSIREKEYIEASLAMGNSSLYTLMRHIIPNCITPITVIATYLFANVLLAESALSFLGLGVPAPEPTWGGLLAESRQYYSSAPWLSLFPGMVISGTLIGINLLGDALRDVFDPRMT